MILKKALFTLLIGVAATASAQTPDLPSSFGKVQVTASIDTDSIIVGDQLTLRIAVVQPDGFAVSLPSLEELSNGAIEALESSTDTTKAKDGKVQKIEQQVTITSFTAGHQPVGGIVVRLETPQGIILLAPQDSLFLDVYYVADADTVKCETKGDISNIREPLTFIEIVRCIAYLLIAVIVVFAAILLIAQRKGLDPLPILSKAKPVPADRRALNELENLRRKELWQKGRIKKYYTDMTDIVRRFLHNMYGIAAGEMTTRQTLHAFHSISDWSEESEKLLRQLLQKADMVKFAKSQPESYEHDQAMQFAVDFVRSVAEQHKLNENENENENESNNNK